MAEPGSVYITGETQALTQGLIETRSLGPREIKGSSVSIDVHEATGASLNRSRWLAATGRDRAPFVGRLAERAAALGVGSVDLSMTHSRDLAQAVAVASDG